MLTPEYLSSVPDAMVELYAQAERDILADMARRINGFDMFIPSAQYQMQVLEEMGALRSDIIAELGRLTGKSQKELASIMREAGMKSLAADGAIYKAAGLSSSPAAASSAVKEALAAGLKKTNGLFTNLTRTTANTATKQFERALDHAYMAVTSGAIDPTTAVKGALKDLAKQGVGSIEYPSGHVDSIEVAVRRATVTGINQTCLKMQEARADELGVDLVEVTAHAGARPSHAEWQGQVYSRSGKSSKYPDFIRSTGYGTGPGLGGWNCSHSFRPYIDGMPRTYSKELLNDYAKKEYEYNGRAMTEYEALQQQRELERRIRQWKREAAAMKAAGLDASEATAKVTQWNKKQADFINQTGLKRQRERERIASAEGVAKPSKGAIIKAKAPKTQTFQPAKTIKEADNYAHSTLGIPGASYKGCSTATANEWNRGLADTFSRFPEMHKQFGFVGECHERNAAAKTLAQQVYMDQLKARNPGATEATLKPFVDRQVKGLMSRMKVSTNTFAESWSPSGDFSALRGICVNREWGKDEAAFKAALQRNVATKFHPVGCDSIRSVLDHEIGHQLDDLLDIHSLQEVKSLFDKRTTEQLTEDLSRYAWDNRNRNKYSEMIAEAWAEYCNAAKPREIASVIGKAIEREYAKKFKGE